MGETQERLAREVSKLEWYAQSAEKTTTDSKMLLTRVRAEGRAKAFRLAARRLRSILLASELGSKLAVNYPDSGTE